MNDNDQHPVDRLAEEFAAAIRSGRQPLIEDYAARFPEHAEMIRIVFPSIEVVEKASRHEHRQRAASAGLPPLSLTAARPQCLGDFEIVREVGRGGMGVVYEAVQRSLRRRVALKVISGLIAGSEKQLKRFQREAESAASLHHNNIVPVYGIGEDHGLQYYAMQLIDGVTLAEVLRCLNDVSTTGSATSGSRTRSETPFSMTDHTSSLTADTPVAAPWSTVEAAQCLLGGPLPDYNSPQVGPPDGRLSDHSDIRLAATRVGHHRAIPESELFAGIPADSGVTSRAPLRLSGTWFQNVTRIIANVADALQYAHHQNILHRDIKPGNLLLDRDGTIWVTDFGLARHTQSDGVTQTGEIVGTLRYMAPEQLRGEADPRTDVYALGLTLYELLTLQPAVNAPRILSGGGNAADIRAPRAIRPEIPRDLETITLKAIAPEPARRYQSAAEFEADLRRFLDDRPIRARRVTSPERLWRWSRRNPVIAFLSAATLILLTAIAGLTSIANHQKQLDLTAIRSEYDRAEQNLREKSAALSSAERERSRAESNLDLAVKAFEEVFDNIAARGQTDLLFVELDQDDDTAPSTDAVLSAADVTLLETLLGFFDQLAEHNSKDLSTESATARRRVGDIQQQLGRLEDAEVSYRMALAGYQQIAGRQPGDLTLVLPQVAVLQELMTCAARRGQFPRALDTCDEIRSLLASSPQVSQSQEGRFALATTINRLVSQALRSIADPRLRPRGIFPLRPNLADNAPVAPLNARIRREADAGSEALTLLKGLLAEDADNVSYRLAFAQALKNQARLARLQRDVATADEALQQARDVLASLSAAHPSTHHFKFELAETLSISVAARPADIQRLNESLQLSRELAESHRDVAEYRALYATVLSRMAAVYYAQGRRDRAEEMLRESISHHQQLADQYPDVVLYQMGLARTVQQLAELYFEWQQPELARSTLDNILRRLELLQGSGPGSGKPAVQQLISRLKELRKRGDERR